VLRGRGACEGECRPGYAVVNVPADGPSAGPPPAGVSGVLARLHTRLAARSAVEAPLDDPALRRAAVALCLGAAMGGALDLLCIRRAERAGDPWSGQVALPGGREDPADASLEATAVRETFEEVGFDLRRAGRILGVLDDLRPRTPTLPPIIVRPFVVAVPRDLPVTLSDEVAAAFWVPLAALLAEGASVETTVRVRGTDLRVPAFHHDGHVIWGMTERILQQLLALLR
jgi:8-oxo-dGTP pyrophosphatase MutT (NUDIX family)